MTIATVNLPGVEHTFRKKRKKKHVFRLRLSSLSDADKTICLKCGTRGNFHNASSVLAGCVFNVSSCIS